MSLLALGVDASALEERFGVREIAMGAWFCRSGMQGRKLHEMFLIGQACFLVRTGIQYRRVKALLLRAHRPLWPVEEREGEEAGPCAVWRLLYGQVIKHQRRRRTMEVERLLLWGEEKYY